MCFSFNGSCSSLSLEMLFLWFFGWLYAAPDFALFFFESFEHLSVVKKKKVRVGVSLQTFGLAYMRHIEPRLYVRIAKDIMLIHISRSNHLKEAHFI